MKRSTCKEVKQAIRQYILDHITLDNYGIDESSLSNSEKILKVFQIFQQFSIGENPMLFKIGCEVCRVLLQP